MGTNLASAPLANAPQTGALVCATATLAGAAVAAQACMWNDEREVLRCPHCRLTQFRTQNSHCRRCRASLDALPEPPAVIAPAPAEIEPGIETAEATGIPVPEVARAIRVWRQRRGLSQRQLAERMQVPRTYVSKIENDKATPTIASLHRMAAAMETSIVSLLEPLEPAAGADDLMRDPFVCALLPYLEKLGKRDLGQLLDASRRLAQA